MSRSKKPRALICHSKEGRKVAAKLHQCLQDKLICQLWVHRKKDQSITELQMLENNLHSFDYFILVLIESDFNNNEQSQLETWGEMIKLGMAIATIRLNRVFYVIPEEFDIKLPKVLQGHNPILFNKEDLNSSISIVATTIENQVDRLGLRPKHTRSEDAGIINLLKTALVIEPDDYQRVLSVLINNIIVLPEINLKPTGATLFSFDGERFIQFGAAGEVNQGLVFEKDDTESWVVMSYQKGEISVYDNKEQDLSGCWEYIFSIPMQKLNNILSIHFTSKLEVLAEKLDNLAILIMTNNQRLIKAMEYILKGRFFNNEQKK